MLEESPEISSLKKRILDQNKCLDNLEKEYDAIELDLLEKEEKLFKIKNELLEKYKGKASSISEIVTYINSKYEYLEKKVSEIENQPDKNDHKQIFDLLKDLDEQLSDLAKSLDTTYSFQENLNTIYDMLDQLENHFQ